jgi:hypothetical protein
MSPNNAKRRRQKKTKIKDNDVQGGKFLRPMIRMLAPLHEHCPDPKRALHYDEYCFWLLLYFFNPVLDSMRGLQQASDIESLCKRMRLKRFSLGSFSEAGTVFDPALLEPIIEELGQCLEDIEPNRHLMELDKRPIAVDGTLIRALPKMTWALWRDDEHRAAKMHLHLDLLKGVPEAATLTHAQASEIDTLKSKLLSGRLYVTDRGYFSFDLMDAILRKHSSFVGRVRNNLRYETLEERPVSKIDKQRGVQSDRIVRAGLSRAANLIDQPLRLVEIHVSEPGLSRRSRVDSKTNMYRTRERDHTILLLTDRLDLDVETISMLYRYRWQIELFFRWFKKVLQADHLLSLSENGMTIVLYCALIASMLITLWTGRKPTKRTFEMLCFYFMGWAEESDLESHIERLKENAKNK